MQKKLGLTIERHDELGLELQTMCDKLMKIESELEKVYSQKRIYRLAEKSRCAIDSLRNTLDNKVCKEYPDREDAHRIYYRVNRPDYKPQ